MNKFIKALAGASLAIILCFSASNSVYGCDRSGYVLDSVVFDGTEYSIYTTFCIGGGVIGSTFGADNFTATFAFGLYGPASMQMTGYSPPFVISDTTNCLANSVTFSGGSGMNVDTGIAYIPSCVFTCINSTFACGRPHSDCNQLRIDVTELPDSIRLFGIEGTGNPIAGCFPNPEMGIFFNTLPVIWRTFDVQQKDETVDITWSTSQENNNSHFRIMRIGATGVWEELSTVNAVGYSEDHTSYDFTDAQPLPGINRYKVVQVDNDGRSSETEPLSVNFELEADFAWRQVGPIPTHDQLDLAYIISKPAPLQLNIFNLNGEVVYTQAVDAQFGLNRMSLDLNTLANGAYFLSLSGPEGKLSKKIVKI